MPVDRRQQENGAGERRSAVVPRCRGAAISLAEILGGGGP